MKNSSDNVDNQTRDLQACIAVPQTNWTTTCPFHTNSDNSNELIFDIGMLFWLVEICHLGNSAVYREKEFPNCYFSIICGNLFHILNN